MARAAVRPYDVAGSAPELSPALLSEYVRSHANSKAYVAASRPRLSDNRNIANFSLAHKEACHPIVAESARAAGSCHVRDADGNELIDLGGGFGVVLFGHNPPFVRAAVAQMIRSNGWGLGFAHTITAQNAAKVCQLTGMERCAFVTTGSEATALAYRMCLRHTGRRRVVMFEGAYHGHFDGFLGQPADGSLPDRCMPVAPGIPAAYTRDLIVLKYDDDASLAYIEEHAEQIAGIFCEPVQNRHPAVVPRAFLQRLRAITESAGIVLVFDEVVTGFRVAAGGVQELLGVRCDLACYGKALGGGYHIGCVAGTGEIMGGSTDEPDAEGAANADATDVRGLSTGGSGACTGGLGGGGAAAIRRAGQRPHGSSSFLAGTFSEHPLVMAAVGAVLDHIMAHAPSIYPSLRHKTDEFARALNCWWREKGYELRIDNFCSMFRFQVPAHLNVVFYQTLLLHGVYCWEGRTCFLTTAHTDEDIALVIEACKRTTYKLAESGITLPRREEHT